MSLESKGNKHICHNQIKHQTKSKCLEDRNYYALWFSILWNIWMHSYPQRKHDFNITPNLFLTCFKTLCCHLDNIKLCKECKFYFLFTITKLNNHKKLRKLEWSCYDNTWTSRSEHFLPIGITSHYYCFPTLWLPPLNHCKHKLNKF